MNKLSILNNDPFRSTKHDLDLMKKVSRQTDELRNANISGDLQSDVLLKTNEQLFKPFTDKLETVKQEMKKENDELLVGMSSKLQNVKQEIVENAKETAGNASILKTVLRDPKFDGFPPYIRKQLESGKMYIGDKLLPWFRNLESNAYGVTWDPSTNKYWVGNDKINEVKFEGNDFIVFTHNSEDSIEPSNGLLELLTRIYPSVIKIPETNKYRYENLITAEDFVSYRKFCYDYGILFRENGSLRSSQSRKYKEFLKNCEYAKMKPPVIRQSETATSVGRNLLNRSLNRSLTGNTINSPNTTTNFEDANETLGSGFSNSLTNGKGVSRVPKIVYLPGSIRELRKTYDLYFAHLLAGHTLDYAEAEAIAGELLKKGALSKSEYYKFLINLKSHRLKLKKPK